MQTADFELTVYPRKYWGIIISLIIILLIFGRLFPYVFDFTHLLDNLLKGLQFVIFLVYYVFAFFLLQEFAWLIAKVVITINLEKLTITKFFFGIPFTKTYQISKISHLKIEYNVPGKWYIAGRTGKGKPLIKDPTVLYYTYEGTIQKIGPHLNNFPAESIINAIENRQKK